MPSLSDLVSSASAQINVSVNLPSSGLSNALGGAIRGLEGSAGSVVGGITGAVSNAVRGVENQIGGAVAGVQREIGAVAGQVQAAVNTVQNIINAPAQIMNKLSSFGINVGASLSAPSFPSFDTGGFVEQGGFDMPSFDTGSVSSIANPLQGTTGADPGNSLAGALARSDPMLSFCWYAMMPDISPQGGGIESLPWYFVEEATIPFRTFDVRSIFREGRQRHYPSTYTVDTLRLAIYQDSGNFALSYLQGWQQAILFPDTSANTYATGGGYGRPSQYKASIFIHLFDVAKNELVILEYTECWPISIDAYTLDSGSSTRIMNHVTFSVGDVFMTLQDAPSQSFSPDNSAPSPTLPDPVDSTITYDDINQKSYANVA